MSKGLENLPYLSHTFTVNTTSASGLKLEEYSRVTEGVLLYISARRAKLGRKTINKKELANDTVFDSAFLSLENGDNQKPVRQLPLSKLDEDNFKYTNCPGHPFFLKDIRTNQCTIDIFCDDSDIVKTECFEITMYYVPSKNL